MSAPLHDEPPAGPPQAGSAARSAEPLLAVEGLSIDFGLGPRSFRAVENVAFSVRRGGCLGIVGESGSGKTVTALSLMRLLPEPPAVISGGTIRFAGRNLVKATDAEMRRIRGREIAMIFQEPMTALNPVMTVGDQIAEMVREHERIGPSLALRRASDMLKLVGIPDPEQRLSAYPHQMSGGMRQRVMIAIALSCDPKLLIADEPTTALDVTIQAQILDLIRRLRHEVGAAVIMITHDLGVVAELADEVVVMYAGRVVEKAPVDAIFASPQHPYTEGLIRSMPKVEDSRRRLETISGSVPSPRHMPPACRFHPRCPLAQDICRSHVPPFREVTPGRSAACWRHSGFRLEHDGGVP